MPSPSSTLQRPDLGWGYEEFSLASQMAGFRAMQVLPPVPTSVASGNYSKVVLEQLLNDDRSPKRAPGAEYERGHVEFTQANFTCEERGLEEVLDQREMAQFAYTGLMFEQLAADRALAGVLRHFEREAVALLQDTGTFSKTDVTHEWDDPSNAVPIDDVLAGVESFRAQGGLMPNALLMSGRTLRDLQTVDSVIDRIKYSGIDDPKQVTLSQLAGLFHVDEIIVFDEQYNSAQLGQTASLADIWDDEYVLLAKIAKSADPREPGIGRTFQFGGVVVEQYYEPRVRGDVVRARIDVDPVIIHAEAGYLLGNITA